MSSTSPALTTAMKPAATPSCACLPSLSCFGVRPHRKARIARSRSKKYKKKLLKDTTNPGITMSATNIIPFTIPVGHLESTEPRPMYQLPPLPDILNKKTMRAVLRIDKKKRKSANSGAGEKARASKTGTGNDVAVDVGSGDARAGEKLIEGVVDDILAVKGKDLYSEEREAIRQSFLTDDQAHYLAMCYHMELHIHHYGNWAGISTRDMAEVFRRYIGALGASNEMGVQGVQTWLHKLLDGPVAREVEYKVWKGPFEKRNAERGVTGGGINTGRENERVGVGEGAG
ncbi:hypothetical protein DRE_04823 [Drechslerella stenobrocha 248]|uniref:Uncharacterized protein n=1 Tax=Drechslerella stenobrocha 248 TaxID=1043628 RepID=W7IAF8_9PEZI|nr:hypothetical protein DRE_04823 [Drechslerella stenobrocha 248]